ncbi:VOC family protein [Homoserinimonas hongtaonis]|uniref:VOC family protein n=1 Tax=Homoserinimonas hongtaonis TaxID=2079791 RepID=UPI000D3A4D2A|nr:VOC family protein [Salinibacterium hongtaonis]AWB88402.1 hypothetical protein C2138_01530 [Salinibacterium hongtaonis]
MTSKIVPCIWLTDQAEQAAAFYTSAIGGRILATSYFPESSDNPSGRPPGSVLTVEFEVRGQRLTALNGGGNGEFRINPSISFFIEMGSAPAVDRMYAALSAGAHTLMGPDSYAWSERYAWVQDRYGVSWQIMATDAPGTRVIPSLLFSGEQQGRAEEAMEYYTHLFDNSSIETVSRFTSSDAGPEGKVAHARFVLESTPMVAMDSAVEQPFTFSEALSLQVMCADQAEIDRLWNALTEGGRPSQCGWLADRFGVSWQIVPARMDAWMTTADTAARDRVFQALMPMTKIDIATLESAARGETTAFGSR